MALPDRAPDAAFTLAEADWRAWRRDVLVRRFGLAGVLLSVLGVGSWGVVGGAWWAVLGLVALIWATLVALGVYVDRRPVDERLLRSGTWRVWLEDGALVVDSGSPSDPDAESLERSAHGTLWLGWRRLRARRSGRLLLVRVGQAWLVLLADAFPDAVASRLSASWGRDVPPPRHPPGPGYALRTVTYRSDLRWRARVLRASQAGTFRARVLPWIAAPVVVFAQLLACAGAEVSAPAQTASVVWAILATMPWWRPWLGAWVQGRGVRDPSVELAVGPAGLWLLNDMGTSRVPWERVVGCRRTPGLTLLDLGGQAIGLPDPAGAMADAVEGFLLRERAGARVEAPTAANPFEAPRGG